MKIDFQNLSAYESSVVIIMVLAMMLMSSLIFADLSLKQQDDLIAGLSILDMQAQVSKSIENLNLILGFRLQDSPMIRLAYGARVAGTMIELADFIKNLSLTEGPQASLSPPEVKIPYSFAPLKWQPIKQEIINNWSQ